MKHHVIVTLTGDEIKEIVARAISSKIDLGRPFTGEQVSVNIETLGLGMHRAEVHIEVDD